MGTEMRADTVRVFANSQTWLEGTALQQLQHTAQLPGMVRVAGMPDLHPGRGYPVGAAFFSVGRIYPALVGNDIGCGMALWQTDLPLAKHSAARLERRLGSLDDPLDADEWADELAACAPALTGHRAALGTIGGGNHFAELQAVDAVLDADHLPAGFDTKALHLLVHSGSRGLGQAILTAHVSRFGHAGLLADSADGAAYIAEHDAALEFAALNRRLIALRILARLGGEGACLLDVHHNFVARAEVAGESGWLHRKGATPADAGLVVIPGSRGDFSYLVAPLTDAAEAVASLYSLAHGAGRKWQRSECEARLRKRYPKDALRKTRLGSLVVCDARDLLYEEAPEAYKDVDNVVQVLAEAGLLRLVARLRPVLTYKTREAHAC